MHAILHCEKTRMSIQLKSISGEIGILFFFFPPYFSSPHNDRGAASMVA